MPGTLAAVPDVRSLVAGAPVGRLATLGTDGRPHLVPCCFVLDGEVLYSAVDAKPKRSPDLQRLAHVRARPDVALLVDHYEEDWSKLWWVRLRGKGRVLEAGPEADRARSLLARKYPQYRHQPPTGPVLAVDVTDWQAWSAEGVLSR
jgi:PPOX class probable F420-dependent enzyme